jgi:hypothetical protein
MKRITIGLASLAVLLCVGGVQAATMSQGTVVRDYTDTVAPADQQAYEAGVKAYNQCMSQHGFKYAWTAWTHETGDTYTYSYTTDPVTWADFDTMHATGSACDSVWQSSANPHLKSETSAFMVMMPGMSYMPKDMGPPPALVDVIYFTLKNGQAADEAFTNGVKMIYAAAVKTNWSGYSTTYHIVGGGPGAPDYILVIPAKNWADFGTDPNPPVWTMVANAYGKQKAQGIRNSINGAIETTSEHVDSYNADLTFTPSGH